MKNLKFAFLCLFTLLLLGACSDSNKENETSDSEAIKQLVHDYSTAKLTAESASISSHELVVTNTDKSQVVYELPEDEFFVSIAPYISKTHP